MSDERDPVIARLFRAGAQELPSERLDRAILAAARASTGGGRRPKRWWWMPPACGRPLAFATVAVLAVSLSLVFRSEDMLDPLNVPREATRAPTFQEGPAALPRPGTESGQAPTAVDPGTGRDVALAEQARQVVKPDEDARGRNAFPRREVEAAKRVEATVTQPPPADAPAARESAPFHDAGAPRPAAQDTPAGVGAAVIRGRVEEKREADRSFVPPPPARPSVEAPAVASRSSAPASPAVTAPAAAPPPPASPPLSASGLPDGKATENRAVAASGVLAKSGEPERQQRERTLSDEARRAVAPAPPATVAAPRRDDWNPEKWLESIEQLRREGRHAEAKASLDEFRKRHPAYPVPKHLE